MAIDPASDRLGKKASRESRRPAPMLPLVHIIVLTFNGRRHLEGCFSSLRYTEYTNYRVWLVDNASVDGSGDFVAERFPEVGVLRNRRNLGFARGNNLVILAHSKPGPITWYCSMTIRSFWIRGG